MAFHAIPIQNRFELLRIAKELLHTSQTKDQELDRITVTEWLTQVKQSDRSKKYLWDVITLGALNNNPQKVSALMLYRVLRSAFFGKRENSSLLIPQVELSKLFVETAVRFIQTHGGFVQTGIQIERIMRNGTCVQAVRTSDGKEFSARSFICAVPWYAYDKIMSTVISPDTTSVRSKSRLNELFRSSPIISIHLWLDRTILKEEFAALIDTRIQWVFNKGVSETTNKKGDEKKNRQQHLSLVISGAEEFLDLQNEQLVNIAMEDLHRVLPNMQETQVIRSRVIKERRATFLPSPGLEAHRPDTRTEYENFYLAGDWTATGFPATIEGAIMSGRKAAEAIEGHP